MFFFFLILWYPLFHHRAKKSIIWQKFLSFCTTMTSGLLPYISWSVCTVKSHSVLYFLLPLACAHAILSHIFYIFRNCSLFQTNRFVFYTLFGVTCCIHLEHDLHALQYSTHSAFLVFFGGVLSIFAFMLLVFLACSCAAIMKASVVLLSTLFLAIPINFLLLYPLFTW